MPPKGVMNALVLRGQVYCSGCEAGPDECGMRIPIPAEFSREEAEALGLRYFQHHGALGLSCPHCGADYHHLLGCNPVVVAFGPDEYAL